MLADALVEHGLPRHQLEADSVLDHGEAAAGEAGDAGERPLTYSPALLACRSDRARLPSACRHAHLLSLQIGDDA